VQHEQLVGVQWDSRIGSAIIIHKLHLKHTWAKRLHHGPHLPAQQATIRDILGQSHHIEYGISWFMMFAPR